MIETIKIVHVEITNNCNARCPGCARTFKGDHHPLLKNNLTNWSLDDFKSIFSPEFVENKRFVFGVVVDEPLMNPNFLDIVNYLIENNVEHIELHTNAGAGTKETWLQLGKISKETNKIFVYFSIDGFEHTNQLYRVNVKWSKVISNITTYSAETKNAAWVYLVFEHNEHDIQNAAFFARKLGIEFKVRANTRNIESWPTVSKIKINNKVVEQSYKVNPTKNKNFEHSAVEDLKKKKISKFPSLEQVKTINCSLHHQGEIFIDWSKKLWPCCWFGSDYFDREKYILSVDKHFGEGWNSLKDKKISEVLEHPYYKKYHQLSWIKGEKFYSGMKCFRQCGDNNIRTNYEYFDENGKKFVDN